MNELIAKEKFAFGGPWNKGAGPTQTDTGMGTDAWTDREGNTITKYLEKRNSGV